MEKAGGIERTRFRLAERLRRVTATSSRGLRNIRARAIAHMRGVNSGTIYPQPTLSLFRFHVEQGQQGTSALREVQARAPAPAIEHLCHPSSGGGSQIRRVLYFGNRTGVAGKLHMVSTVHVQPSCLRVEADK